jgi:APA family basic amino acid/polyamine antiporter
VTIGRSLTLPHARALVVSSMIGTGVFTTAGLMLETLGSPAAVLAAWLAGGLLALCGAAVYAELGAMMPRAGGEYVYLSRAFHPALGFVSGFVALFVGFAAPAAAGALAFGRYLHAVAPAVPERGAAFVLLAAVTTLHAREVRRGGAIQAVLAATIVGVIVVFVGAALVAGDVAWSRLAAATPATGGAGTFAVALVFASYAYFGWNAAGYVAGEVREPDRTLPRALLGGAAIVTILYVALNGVFLASAPAADLAGRVEVGDVAARALFGPRGGAALSLLIALALAGSVSALSMTGPRVVQAMAADGAFFRGLAPTNRHGAPTRAVLLQGALAMLGAATATVEPLLVYAGFTLTLSAAATVAGAFVLRRREPSAPRPHRALAWPASGLAFLALSAFMLVLSVRERPLETLAGVATLIAGGIAWAGRGRGGKRQDARAEEPEEPEQKAEPEQPEDK